LDEEDIGIFLKELEKTSQSSKIELFQLRVKGLKDREKIQRLIVDAQNVCDAAGTKMLLNSYLTTFLSGQERFSGIHLESRQLMALQQRPFEKEHIIGASCHSKEQLLKAAELGLDFATLSPVLPTKTHPEASPLGWEVFERLVKEVSLPIFALGGVGIAFLDKATNLGAHGIASIRSEWKFLRSSVEP
jgi:thiamine-phosphate pyrophosphorylase